MDNEKDKITEAVLEKTFKEGEKVKLRCADALNIAKIFGVKPLEIGRICNQKKIRMSQCQLGCFK